MRGTLALWSCYFLGQLLNILVKADLQAMSKYTPWDSVRTYINSHQAVVIFRLFIATAVFVIWWENPVMLNFTGFDVASKLPLNMPTAAIYGGLSDRLIDWVIAKMDCHFEGAMK